MIVELSKTIKYYHLLSFIIINYYQLLTIYNFVFHISINIKVNIEILIYTK